MKSESPLVRLSPGTRLAAVWGPTLIVLAFGALAYWANLREARSRLATAESYRVIETLQVLLGRLVDAETGQRGYLLTARPDYLRPYLNARSDVQRDLAVLRRLTRDSPAEQARLDSLGTVVNAKFAELEETIALRRTGTLQDVLPVVSTDFGMLSMARARALTAAIRGEEMHELAVRSRQEADNSSALAAILVIGSLLAAGVSLKLNGLVGRYARSQERIAGELEAANRVLHEQQEELEVQNEHLQAQSVELEMQTIQLQEQFAELQAQNEYLGRLGQELELRTEAAEAANRAKASFLAAMSHDLRTPLNAIIGYVDLLSGSIYGPVNDAQESALQRILSSSRRLLALINDILNFARVEAGKVEISLRPVRLDAALRDLEASFLPQVQARQLAYECGGCDRELSVEADRDRMEQVLLNLVTNAIKFTEPGGKVSLHVVEQGDDVLVQVADTGSGIPADRLGDVFSAFVQVNQDRTDPSHRGIGLGLAISRKLAQAMGGDISVESEEGVGSCFTLRLRRAGPPREDSACNDPGNAATGVDVGVTARENSRGATAVVA